MLIPEEKKMWSVSTEEVFSALRTSEKGLAEEEARKRLRRYGSNTFTGRERAGFVSMLTGQFLSPLIFLLLAAAVITLLLGEWINTLVIFFAVFLNVSLGFYHEYHAENTLDKLKTYIKERVRVIRDGREAEIDSSLLVPGDLVKLNYGFRVPADVRIVSARNLGVDESILTGESLPVEKNPDPVSLSAILPERRNMAYSGTMVVDGYATGVVCATGSATEIGRIAGMVSDISRVKTPLRRGVDRLSWMIFFLAIVVVSGIALLGLARGESLLPMLMISTAIAVGAVPEALPVALTVILSVGATRIAAKKGIVRKLSAAETLGSATLIMTDKTGTLTEADMRLVGVYSRKDLIEGREHKEDQKSFFQEQKKLLGLALYNLDLSVENREASESAWSFRGRPFEVNIAKSCVLHGVALDALKSDSSHLVLPFNSTNKFSVSTTKDGYVVMGAPDILLRRADLSKDEYLKIESWIDSVSSSGKRLIALAAMPFGRHAKRREANFADDVTGLEFLGVLVFHDPVRKEVPGAIKNIHSHGIKIVLLTGDLPGTAMSVAKELGWEVSDSEILTGLDLRSLSDQELSAILPKIKIFARVTPEDKLRVGKLYQQAGEVVAMTGDGVNDAPALKAMDIGVSLGSGSDVAKAAADLVLLDDNFHTVSLSIDEGRKILGNIRKAVVYLLSNSLDAVFVVGGSLLFGLPVPVTALQIIWVNLFTGSLPALSFAFDEDIDRTKYAGSDLRLIFSREVKLLSLVIGALSSILLFVLYYLLLRAGLSPEIVRSVFFVCFSSYILAVAFSFRSLHHPLFSYNPFSNHALNASLVVAFLLLILTLSVPFFREIFDIGPMPLVWIPLVLFWIALNVLLVEGAKYVFRRLK